MRIRVEDLRRRISELEASNQSLGHKASELQINLQDQAASYQSKVGHCRVYPILPILPVVDTG